jgi:hypothetical protein
MMMKRWRERLRLPLFGPQLLLNVLLLRCTGRRDFTLTGLGVLYKGAVLLVEVTQDTDSGSFVDYTATLATTTRIARALSAGPDAGQAGCGDGGDGGNGAYCCDSSRLELDKVLLS